MVATFIFEPVKAGRSFKAARQQYGDLLFKDEHDVSIYHAASYLSFKLEIMFRKGVLDRELKIFRTYIQAAVGVIATGGKDVFKMSKKDSSALARSMLEFCQSDERLVEFINSVCQELEKNVIAKRGAVTRDALRADEVMSDFRSMMLERARTST